MKKLLMICGMLFGVMTFAHAQGGNRGGTPEERATKSTAQLTEKLTLTADQQTKIHDILLDQNTQMNKAREEAGDDRKAMRTKMMTLMQGNNEKIKAVLTDDQKKAYETFLEDRRNAMKNRAGGQGGNKPAEN